MNPRVRLGALIGAWVLLVLVVAFAVHVIAPFAGMEVSVLGCAAVGIAIVIAGRMTREKKAFASTSIFDIRAAIGNLAIVIGGAGVAGFLLFDHWHESVWVENTDSDIVEISVDGHELGTVMGEHGQQFENVPTNAERITATDQAGKPVDTADIDDAAGDAGRFVFDVGGRECWQIREVSYTQYSAGLGGEEPTTPITIGNAHLFRAKSDYVGSAPSSVSSKSSSVTRTLLEPTDCEGRAR